MSTKNRMMIRILAGGYLAYLGGNLAMNSIKERPDNFIIFVIVGLVFLIFGLYFFAKSAMILYRKDYEEPDESGASEEEHPEESDEEKTETED